MIRKGREAIAAIRTGSEHFSYVYQKIYLPSYNLMMTSSSGYCIYFQAIRGTEGNKEPVFFTNDEHLLSSLVSSYHTPGSKVMM